MYYSLIIHLPSLTCLNVLGFTWQQTQTVKFNVGREVTSVISLTVGAEQALKLSNQANEVKLPQEAFVLHSRVQPHDETTGQGCQLFNTQSHKH